ncbi:MAG: hypothetical protein ACQEWV_17845 [Bacillota bacterium]
MGKNVYSSETKWAVVKDKMMTFIANDINEFLDKLYDDNDE